MSASTYDFLFKFISVGDSGVGKSCLLQRLTSNQFQQTETTIGIEFGSKNIQVDGRVVKLQIWDTAGQESFRSISRAYYRNAAGCLLVFDMGRRDTFLHLKTWLEDVSAYGNDMIRCIVVANKSDQESKRVVTREEAQAFAAENSMLYIESSAKSGRNVEEIFTTLAQKIFRELDLKRDISQFKEEEFKKLESCGIKVGPRKPLVLVPSPSSGSNNSCC